MEKQEWGFTQWLNFVFTPLLDEESGGHELHASKVLDMSSTLGDISLAATKEAVSLKTYADWRELNALRREASRLFQSDDFAKVARRLEKEVEDGRFLIRKDVCFRADKGTLANDMRLIGLMDWT